MTRTTKCDTCRSRKVKCDERKPKCSACRKRDRECTYSFGKVSAFVVEDPTQLTKHGKSMAAPLIYPLDAAQVSEAPSTAVSSAKASSAPPETSSAVLRQTTGRYADGQGVPMTLATPASDQSKRVRKPTAQQRRKLQQLQHATALWRPRPFATCQTVLAASYLNLLGSRPAEEQPFYILGSWVESIPSRIGKSPAVDLAVEYLVSSFDVHREPSFTNSKTALISKAKALKALQLAVGNETTRRSYDTAIAMKLHFMAEIFMGIKNLYHAIHAAGLSDILQSGLVTGCDDDHYWSFLDNTYIDDVSEALVASRTSVYDHKLYLDMTSSESIPEGAPSAFRASVAMMHVYIQLPRLVCLVRHASDHPEDSRSLASALTLAKTLWSLVPIDAMQEAIRSSVNIIDLPPSFDIDDLVPTSYHFDSIQNCVLISRFWMLQVNLAGPLQTLYQNYPTEYTRSLLPPISIVQQTDVHAAMHLARCLRYSFNVCPSLPLVPLRIHTSLSVSLGTWYRIIRRLNASNRARPPDPSSPAAAYLAEQLSCAQRMENFVSKRSNDIGQMWKIQRVNKKFLRAGAIDMAGGPVPNWLPIHIRFENEDGEMIMKMEYDLTGEIYKEILGMDAHDEGYVRRTSTLSPFHPETVAWMPRERFPDGATGKMPPLDEDQFYESEED